MWEIARGDLGGSSSTIKRWRRRVALTLIGSVMAAGCSWFDRDDTRVEPWFEPLFVEGPATLAALCAADTCVADRVVLPLLRPIEAVVDLPLPSTLGPLTVERLWTGNGSGLFGDGWVSTWDLRLDGGTITGPLPAAPLTRPTVGVPIELEDGSSITFGTGGRVTSVCVDAAPCVLASWGGSSVELTSADARDLTVTLQLADGRVRQAMSYDGRAVTYEYDDGALVTAVGADTISTYDYESGRLTRLDHDGVGRSFSYAAEGSLASMVDRDGGNWSFEYRAGVVTVQPPGADAMRFRFDAGRLVSLERASGQVLIARQWGAAGLLREERPVDGIVLEALADGRVQVTQSRAGAPSQVARLTFDSLGRVTATESASGVTTSEYVGRSERPSSTVRNGAVTAFEYDVVGRLTRAVDADGYEVRIDRNRVGLPTMLTDGLLTTAFEYDEAGRTISERSGGLKSTATYTPGGLLEGLTLPGGGVWEASYLADRLDAFGGVSTQAAAVASEPREAGVLSVAEPVVSALPTGVVEYRYASGHVALADPWGRVVSITVDGRTTSKTYDAAGRLIALQRPDGATYSLEYSRAGRVRAVSDGGVRAELEWHGDLLRSATMSTGTTYRYGYAEDGSLRAATVGEATWSYEYSPTGNVHRVVSPTEAAVFSWDDLGRPTAMNRAGRVTSFEWENAVDLAGVIDNGRRVLDIERDTAGRTTAISADGETSTFSYGPLGDLTGYQLPDTGRVDIAIVNGQVDTLQFDGRAERWEWSGGQVTSVTTDAGEVFTFDWLAPGVPQTIERLGESLVTVNGDAAGRPVSVVDRFGLPVASMAWERGGVESASIGGRQLSIQRDAEHRVEAVSADDVSAAWEYAGGVAVAVAVGDSSVAYRLESGVVNAGRVARGERAGEVAWDPAAGRPVAFATTEGSGSFEYVDGRVATVRYDDRVREVSYVDGAASAEGTGQEFLDDLFTAGGSFRAFDGALLDSPPAAWFEVLPEELGIDLPDVVTGEDVVRDALDAATPDVPFPLIGGNSPDTLAAQIASSLVGVATSITVPIAPDRELGIELLSDNTLVAALEAAPIVGVADSALLRLEGGTCLVCRIADFASDLAGDIAGVAGDVATFVSDNRVARAVAAAAFYAASFAISLACAGTSVLCALASTAVSVGLALLAHPELGLAAAVASVVIDPYRDLVRGVQAREPAALWSATDLVAGMVFGGRSSPLARAARGRLNRVACSLQRVVCVSASRFGDAAEHVADAQRNGAPRLLRLDRTGAAARRQAALRDVPLRLGFDRDEYPFALTSDRANLSIRYVDPTSNRSLGSYLARELQPLPDGARFLVLPID